MKRLKKRKFTLVELMFVVGILVILIGISWVAGNKILRKSAAAQTKAELKMLHAAVSSYKARFGHLPYDDQDAPQPLNFVEYLSKIQPNASGYSGSKREMFAKFRASGMNISTDDYEDISPTSGSTAKDPYDNSYIYVYVKDSDNFFIYSVGVDGSDNTNPSATGVAAGTGGDDIRSDQLNE